MILLLLPILLGALRPPDRWGTRPRRYDLPLAIGMVLGIALLSATVYARVHLRGAGVVTSDFSQYCSTLELARRQVPNTWSPQRSYFVGLLLVPLTSTLGLEDSLFAGAFLATIGTVAGLYLWAWAVGGRTAAMVSSTFFLIFGPLVVLPRTLSFYPEICAGLALLGGTTAMAIRRRTTGWFLAASLLLALAPLLDLKALVWMLPSAAALLVLAVWTGISSAGQAVFRIAMLAGLLAGSWWAGPAIWPGTMRETLEGQMATYLGDVGRRAGLGNALDVTMRDPAICGYDPARGFIWGTSDPEKIPETLSCLRQMRAGVPSEARDTALLREQQKRRMDPYLPLLGGAGAVALGGLGLHALRRRNPDRLLALLVPLPPYLVALQAAYEEEPAIRRLSMALLFAPVLLAAAWTVLYRWRSAFAHYSEVPRGERAASLPLVLAVLALLLVTTGAIVTPLAPQGQPAMEDDGSREWLTILAGKEGRDPVDRLCGEAYATQIRRGQPEGSRFREWYGVK